MDYTTVLQWLRGFFQEPDGKPSSHRLDTITAHFVAFAVILLMSGILAGVAWSRAADPGLGLPIINALIAFIEWLVAMVLAGTTVNQLTNQHLKNNAAAIAGAAQAPAPAPADTTP